jgi:putative oxidoreductase
MAFLSRYEPYLLSILRIVAGLLFFEHGTSKLLHFPHVAMFDHLIPILVVAGVIELVGGALVAVGLFTRVAAIICSGEMAFAYWLGHFPRGGFFPAVNGGDAAILFCFVFLFIAAAGPGPFALSRSAKF